MNQILECCEGVIEITDDVVIHGEDDNDDDQNLHNFMCTACEHSLVFNREKCEVKKDSITFFRVVYDANGAHCNPKKLNLCNPQDASSRKQTTTSTFPRNGYISLTFHPITLHILHH